MVDGEWWMVNGGWWMVAWEVGAPAPTKKQANLPEFTIINRQS